MTALTSSVWHDPERVAKLRDLADQRFSASAIAKVLAKQYRIRLTRNAVIGKCARLGIALNPSNRALASESQNRAETRARTHRAKISGGLRSLKWGKGFASKTAIAPVLPPDFGEEPAQAPESKRLTILDLGIHPKVDR